MYLRKPRLRVGTPPLGRQKDRVVTMLFAEENATGSVGYSSFVGDQYGELRGPQPFASNDLLALVKLPGGGNYAVFQGNAVNTLKSQELTLGEDSVKLIEADTLSYNGAQGRTQVFFTDDVVTLEPDTEYPIDISTIPAVRLAGTLSLGINFTGTIQVLPTPVTLSGTVRGGGSFAGALTVAAVPSNDNVELAGTLRGGGSFTGALLVEAVPAPGPVEMAGTIKPGGAFTGAMLVEAVPVPAVDLAGTLKPGGSFAGAMLVEAVPIPPVELAGTVKPGGAFTGAMTVNPAPVELAGTLKPGGAFTGAMTVDAVVLSDDEKVSAAMTTQPSTTRKANIKTLVDSLKTAGVWSKLSCLYVFTAHDEQAARVNWKTPGTFTATKVGSPVFTANDNYAGVAGANGLLSGFVPATHGGSIFAQDNACMFEYTKDQSPYSPYDMGISVTSDPTFLLALRDDYDRSFANINSNGNTLKTNTYGTGRALHVLNRNDANNAEQFINGVSLGNQYTSVSTGRSAYDVAMLGYRNGTGATAVTGAPRPQLAMGWGSKLTAAEQNALRTALNAYVDAVVAEVTQMLYADSTTTPFWDAFVISPSNGLLTEVTTGFLDTALPSSGPGAEFSPDNQYVAMGLSASPFFAWYKRQANGNYNKLANPAAAVPSYGNKVAWSPDGQYLAVIYDGGSFVNIYKRTGDTLTKLASQPAFPAGVNYAAVPCWSADGTHLIMGFGAVAPYVGVWKLTNDVFTYLGNPLGITDLTGPPSVIARAKNGQIICTMGVNARIRAYTKTGDTYAQNAVSGAPANPHLCVAFSPDGNYMACGLNVSPYVAMYKRSGSDWNLLAAIFNGGPGTAAIPSMAWSRDSQFLYGIHGTSPFVDAWKRTNDTVAKITAINTPRANNANLIIAQN